MDRGRTANPLASASGLPVDEVGRVRVTEYLSVTGVPDAYAAGDGAAVPDLTRPGAICGPNAQHAAGRPRRSLATSSPGCAASRRGPTATRYLFTYAVLVLRGTLAQINPVWLIGPYQPGSISAGSAPDWYMGFIDGALRIMPSWELMIGGHPLTPGVLIPGLVVPAVIFTSLAVYPVADRWIVSRPPPEGPLLSKPASPANRIAVGVAGITFYGLLWAASANDEIAYHLQTDLYAVTWLFRVLVLAGPVLAFLITRGICHALADRRRDEELHGRETGRIVMNPQGGYTEIRNRAHEAAPPGSLSPPAQPGKTP